MPYALCPMPYARRVPHLSEKGYICLPIVSFAKSDDFLTINHISFDIFSAN